MNFEDDESDLINLSSDMDKKKSIQHHNHSLCNKKHWKKIEFYKDVSNSPPICLDRSNNMFVHIIGCLPPIFHPNNANKLHSKSKSPDGRSSLSTNSFDNAPKAHPSYHTFRNVENDIKLNQKSDSKAREYSEHIKSNIPVHSNINLTLEVEARKLSRLKRIKNLQCKKLFQS